MNTSSPDATTTTVRQISQCFIKPKHQLEQHSNPVHLNTWDLPMLTIRYLRKGLLYHCTSQSQPSSSSLLTSEYLDHLKHTLALTLVHFYPLAGQLETKPNNEDCSSSKRSSIFINPVKGPGAKFIHARAADDEVNVSDLLSAVTDIPHAIRFFFDENEDAINYDGHDMPLLTVQVTELVDGMFIGCSMNHVCGDGTSYWRFINSWSDNFMKKMNSINNGDDDDDRHVGVTVTDDDPLLDNTIIPIHTRWFLDESNPIIELPFDEFIIHRRDQILTTSSSPPPLRERIFRFSSESIRKIKSMANSDSKTTTAADNSNTGEISSFQALSALLWRCVTRARHPPLNQPTSCHIAVNNRGRIFPRLSDNYFGNCVQGVKTTTTTANDLFQQSLGWAATRINRAIRAHGDKEVRESVAAWLRTPKFYEARASTSGGFDVYMVGSARFNVYGNEFGFGRPVAAFKGYGSKDGNVFWNPGRDQGGDDRGSVELQTCFVSDTMRELEIDQEFMSFVNDDDY